MHERGWEGRAAINPYHPQTQNSLSPPHTELTQPPLIASTSLTFVHFPWQMRDIIAPLVCPMFAPMSIMVTPVW